MVHIKKMDVARAIGKSLLADIHREQNLPADENKSNNYYPQFKVFLNILIQIKVMK